MSNRVLSLLVCAASVLPLLGCGKAVPAGPNVVLVVVDTLRPDRLGCYGYPRPTSPELDAIADEFCVFENAQSPAPWTAPALISLMTSAYPNVHGVHGFPVPGRLGEGFTTLASTLREHGYHTAAFTEGGYAKGDFGLDRGFDLFPENPGDATGYTSNLAHPSRLAANLDRTIDWLRTDRADPFFLFFHTYEVHSPPRAPVEDVRVFRPDFDPARTEEDVRVAVEAWNDRRELTPEGTRAMRRYSLLQGRHMGAGHIAKIEEPLALRARAAELGLSLEFDAATQSPEDMAWLADLYDAEIRFTDRNLARLWQAIEEEGLAQDTLLVLVSDHGEALGEHARVGHGHVLHDEVLHVLLMMRIPGLAEGPRRISEPVRTVDVVPTLLELAGIEAGEWPLQGQSLVPLLRGATDERVAFSQATMAAGGFSEHRTLRTERWRLVLDPDADLVELFDLAADPGATRDVAAAHPEVVAALREELAAQDQRDQLLRARLGEVTPAQIDPDSDLMDDLRGLGYTGDDE